MATPYLFLDLRFGLNRLDGESTERFFEDQIVIDSVSWDLKTKHKAPDYKTNVSKVRTESYPKRVKLTKVFDRASINLCDFMAKRKLFESAKITMVKTLGWDEKPRPHIEMRLTKGYVESVGLTASESGSSVGVKEEITLSFSSIKILYYPTLGSGPNGDAAATTFELKLPSDIE